MKERIIGAIVLVAVVVLVVPVFLDGPPAEGEIHSERVPLPGQADQASKTVVLDRNRTDPVPRTASESAQQPTPAPQAAASAQPGQDSAKETAVAKQAPVEQAEPPAKAAESTPQDSPAPQQPAKQSPAPTASSTGMFAVQLGSFSNKANAEQLAADLRKQGFAAFLSQLDNGSADLHRVRVGPQKDRQAAEAMAERLQKAGHSGQVVPHP